jgi:eukaryotic-like serine/threonine-protein kinase
MTRPEDDDTLPSKRALPRGTEPDETAPRRSERHPLGDRPAADWAEGAPEARGSWRPEVRRAGDYELGEILGTGGFGVVYRANHAERRTPAAVKIPHAELADDLSSLARFEREIEAIRRLCHPNVVEILDVGRLEDGRPYFAMELLTGTSLQDHLRSRGRLSPDETLDILEPLCSALDAAHAHAVVHRDIKPSNVFLCNPAERRRVVLLDFGIAKILDATGPALTSSRAVVGTLSCIAPEQFLSLAIDRRTDVYALGALLYTMLTGTAPFGDTPGPAFRQLLLDGRVPRPSSRAPVSAALEEVILRAMSKAKDSRQPSVAALLADIRRAVAHDPSNRAEATSAPARRALGVYIEVLADPDALDEGDEQLLADFESILPCARAHLAEAGLSPAIEAGTSTLLVAPRPDSPARDEEIRRRVLSAMLSLHQRLEARAGRDPRVGVHLCVHEGEILADGSGALVGGDLLELPGWVSELPMQGVFASAPVLAGLGVAGEPGIPSAGAFLRITAADLKAPPNPPLAPPTRR